MAEPARQIYDDEDDDRSLSAQEKANQRWGISEPATDKDEPDNQEEPDGEPKAARERASEKWGMSPEELQGAEEAGADEGQIGEGYNPKDRGRGIRRLRNLKGNFTKRKKIAIAAIGALVAAIGAFFILSGPLQFMHIAQLLAGFHFLTQEDASDDRLVKTARFIRHKSIKDTRLNSLGRAWANRIEGQLNKSGITSGYTEVFEYFDGYVVNPAAIPDSSDILDLKNKPLSVVRAELAERYKLPLDAIEIDNAKKVVKVHGNKMGYYKSKRMIKDMLVQSGYSKTGAAIRARIMGRRAGIDWHPIKKIDRAIFKSIDARYSKWRQDRRQRINKGKIAAPTDFTPDQQTDADGNPIDPSPEAEGVAGTADDVTPPDSPDVTPSGKLANLLNSPGFKVGAGITIIVGIVCAVQAISENFDNIQHANVVLPLMRLGMESVALGSQVPHGKDVDAEVLNFYGRQLSDPKTGTWANARSIQAELGQPLSGPDIRPEAKIKTEENAVAKFLGGIPLLGPLCSAAGTVFGQILTSAFDFFSGPASAVLGAGLSQYFGDDIVEGIAHWLGNEQIDLDVAGADFGNYINYGARLAANDSFIAGGGKKLSGTETAQLDAHRLESQQEALKAKSFAKRIFDPYDNTSLAARLIDKQSPDISTNVTKVASSFKNIGSVFSAIPKTLFSVFSGKASAAEEKYDYGFAEYGFSVDELNNDKVANPFENGDKAIDILNGSKGNDFRDRASKCFGINISEDGTVTSQDSVPAYSKMPDSCTDSDEDWLRVRFYIFDTQLMESAACYEGDSTACASVGLPG
jgi:hypothetical protein